MFRRLNMRTKSMMYPGVAILFIIAVSISGQQRPKFPLALDEREGMPGPKFTLENALWRLSQIKRGLRAYNTLVGNCRRELKSGQLGKVLVNTNIGSDESTVGFANWPIMVETTLRRQNLIIRKLEYELAQERFEAGGIRQEEFDPIFERYRKADSSFHRYFENIRWSD